MKVFILLLFQLFLYSIFSSPECTLKLFCYKNCSSLKIINGKDNTESEIHLDNENIDDSNNKQYTNTFHCEPGDSISFQSHNDDISNDNKIGIICQLEISHALDNANNNIIIIKYDTTSPTKFRSYSFKFCL